MKKKEIFFRTFLICMFIGVVIEVIMCMVGDAEGKFILIELIGEVVVNIIFSLIVMNLYNEVEVNMSEEKALMIIKKNSVKVIHNEEYVRGEIGRYKKIFMGNINYNKKTHVLSGPKRMIL